MTRTPNNKTNTNEINKIANKVFVRAMLDTDIPAVSAMSHRIYPGMPWTIDELTNLHVRFADGQLVAVDTRAEDQQPERLVGFAGCVIVCWDDYEFNSSWNAMTEGGTFANHDPENGRTLYGVEVMVDPSAQGAGIGKLLYAARRELCRNLKLLRIRGGARLANFHLHENEMSPEQYVIAVVNNELGDPTLSFQLKQGFRVLSVVRDYMPRDAESGGHAAVIEWINHRVAERKDYRHRDPRFGKRRKPKERL